LPVRSNEGLGNERIKMNITKEQIEVEVGQVWRDLDKRMRKRTVKIVKVENGFAFYESARNGRLSIKRMYKHSTGWELVVPN